MLVSITRKKKFDNLPLVLPDAGGGYPLVGLLLPAMSDQQSTNKGMNRLNYDRRWAMSIGSNKDPHYRCDMALSNCHLLAGMNPLLLLALIEQSEHFFLLENYLEYHYGQSHQLQLRFLDRPLDQQARDILHLAVPSCSGSAVQKCAHLLVQSFVQILVHIGSHRH